MMAREINAICFDVGGTLFAGFNLASEALDYLQPLQDLLGIKGDPAVFQTDLLKKLTAAGAKRHCRNTARLTFG